MKLLKYKNFILESDFRGFNSVGEYIEDLCSKDDYVLMLTGQKIDKIESTISISNAVNTLDEITKKDLLRRIDIYLKDEEEGKVPIIMAHTEIIEESFGKNVFNTFLKCLTALGLKNNNQEQNEIPDDFIFIFKFQNLQSSKVKEIFGRFKSMGDNEILEKNKNIGLYFGLKTDLYFEYGFINDFFMPIGDFQLNKTNIKSILNNTSKSVVGLKNILNTFDSKEIKLISDIKKALNEYNPGYFNKKTGVLYNDRVLTLGFYGIGKWDNGVLDSGELENFKNNFKNYLLKYKWSDKILVSVSSDEFWLYLKIKLK